MMDHFLGWTDVNGSWQGTGVLDSLRIAQWILEMEMGWGWREVTSSRSGLYLNQPCKHGSCLIFTMCLTLCKPLQVPENMHQCGLDVMNLSFGLKHP